ncbi:type II toxin-antitoxin system PrlF family antitoxin [Microvirga sp. VF16]|uniref:type II toxin-antitoxin system PrlF family antitoxin n=1 Tax=Microvirga sp. VF16 TaxID=2807101 RepID=UPI00193E701E|nr:type II toxin-antitoxin system PrlF family antitoxin [Microvirga sp. VF16]QRM32755.1 type II toxin-antitoxin system PrlF family antitoxin [Microvirga sp. VF16]
MGEPAIFEIEATITERGQTTVPAAVRKMLAVRKRGRVVFRGMPDGTVVIASKEEEEVHTDPVISEFLGFLERDMAERKTAAIRPVSQGFLDDLRDLSDVEIDLDSPLTDGDE